MSSGQSLDDPWQLAKARFLADLDPEEQKLFTHATLENLFYTTDNANRDDAETSRARSASSKLGPLLAAIDNYGKALDIFSSTASLYIAPIWGSIRVVLVLAKTHGKFFDRIVETLERIGDILPRFRDYERIYNKTKHQRLTQALSNAYLEIIVFCTQTRNTLRQQKSSSIRRFVKPLSLDRQFAEAITRFRQHNENVMEEARTCHMIEAAKEINTQLVLRAAERKTKLLARLSKVDCMPRHKKLADSWHEGTGLWLTNCQAYQNWDSAHGSAVLCCYGIPGSGKSVLASSIINSLAKHQKTIFYYCDYADKRTLWPTNIFGTLARQLLAGIDPVPEALAAEIEAADHDGERMLDYKKSLGFFKTVLELSNTPVRVVLDGMDEASDSSQELVFAGFREVTESTTVSLKLIVTGRDELDPLLRLHSRTPLFKVLISADAIALDIGAFVQASTRRRIQEGLLVIRDPLLEEVITKALVEGAKGMFLWVEFQLQDLSEQETDHGIRLVLQNLPRNLSETYDRLLAKIEGVDRRKYIERMFRWLVAAREPLQVDQLLEAIAFTLDDTFWEREKILTDFKRLVRACGNLVVVDTETQTVQLAHYTVQQYIVQGSDGNFHSSMEDADASIGEVCVAYLNFTNFSTHITKFKENAYTDMTALSRVAERGNLILPDNAGRDLVTAWNKIRSRNITPGPIDIAKFLTTRAPQIPNLKAFTLLDYVRVNWLHHCRAFNLAKDSETTDGKMRREALLTHLVLWKELVFEFRPWPYFDMNDNDAPLLGLLGWALMNNHGYLIQIVSGEMSQRLSNVISSAINWLSKVVEHRLLRWQKMELSDEILQKLLPHTDALTDTKTTRPGWLYAMFIYASRKGHLLALEACDLKSYGHLTAKWWFIDHLLIEAAANGHLTLVEYFYRVGAPTGRLYVDTAGQSLNALDQAALGGHLSTIDYLVGRGCQLGNLYHDTKSFLAMVHSAMRKSDIGLLESLLFFEDQLARTALHRRFAMQVSPRQQAEIVRLSIQLGSSNIFDIISSHTVASGFEPGDDNGVSPLLYAACLGNISIVESLSKRHFADRDLNRVTFQRSSDLIAHVYLTPTPLYVACFNGDLEMARSLIVAGAKPQLASPTAFATIQCTAGSILIKDMLPDQLEGIACPTHVCWDDISPNRSILPWQYPIMAAIVRGHFDLAHFLITVGAPPPRLLLTESDPYDSIQGVAEIVPAFQDYLTRLRQDSNIDVQVEVIDCYRHLLEVEAITMLGNPWNLPCPTLRVLLSESLDITRLRSREMRSLVCAIRSEASELSELVLSSSASLRGNLEEMMTKACDNGVEFLLLFVVELGWAVLTGRFEVKGPLHQELKDFICKSPGLRQLLLFQISPAKLVKILLHAQPNLEWTFDFFCWLIVQMLSQSTQLRLSIQWCIEMLESLSDDHVRHRQILKSSLTTCPSSTLEQNILLLAITKNDEQHAKHVLDKPLYTWETSRENSSIPHNDTHFMFAVRLGSSIDMLAISAQASDYYTTNDSGEASLDVAIYYFDLDAIVVICRIFHRRSHSAQYTGDHLHSLCADCIALVATWQSFAGTRSMNALFETHAFANARANYIQSLPCNAFPGVFELGSNSIPQITHSTVSKPTKAIAMSRYLSTQAVTMSRSRAAYLQKISWATFLHMLEPDEDPVTQWKYFKPTAQIPIVEDQPFHIIRARYLESAPCMVVPGRFELHGGSLPPRVAHSSNPSQSLQVAHSREANNILGKFMDFSLPRRRARRD